MHARNYLLLLPLILALGCSSSAVSPSLEENPAQVEIGHSIWGQCEITLNPDDLTAAVDYDRDAGWHFDVTSFFIPPDYFQLLVTGYDQAMRIFDLKLRLRNPSGYIGHDVKAIISNYDLKEFIAPDAYSDFHASPGEFNPYYVFALDEPDHAFIPGAIHERDFQVHVPVGATYNATVTIDASWPGVQEEIWAMDNVIISGPLQNDAYHFIAFTCHVRDHLENIESVWVDLSPLGAPSHVAMGDDGDHSDYLTGDGIYGLGGVITSAVPGLYDIWIYSKSVDSTHLTAQKITIDVIEPVQETTPLYIVSMMHAEEQSFFLEEAVYLQYANNIRNLKQVFNNHGAKIALQPDWTFIQGTVNFDPSLFADFQADGHGVDAHAHESHFNIAAVHNMLDDAGVAGTIIANGGWNQIWNPNLTWAAYLAHFTDDFGNQMFLAANAYKWPPTQEVDSLFTPIRPSFQDDWMVHDPDSPIVYIPGAPFNSKEIANSPHFHQLIQDAADHAIRGIVPGKINCLYWHDSVHNYSGPNAQNRINDWDATLGSYFDAKVGSGEIVWANFSDMYQAYIDWENDQ